MNSFPYWLISIAVLFSSCSFFIPDVDEETIRGEMRCRHELERLAPLQ